MQCIFFNVVRDPEPWVVALVTPLGCGAATTPSPYCWGFGVDDLYGVLGSTRVELGTRIEGFTSVGASDLSSYAARKKDMGG